VNVQHEAVLLLPPALLITLIAGIFALAARKPVDFAVRLLRLDRIKPVASFISNLLSTFETYKTNPALLVRAMGISFLFQFGVVLCIYLITKTVFMDIPFGDFCVFVPFIGMLEAMPISIYGVGLRDAGYLLFFSEAGITSPEQHALSVSVLYVALTILYTMVGGVLFVHRLRGASERASSASKPDALPGGKAPPAS
jgi:hypothetical protein